MANDDAEDAVRVKALKGYGVLDTPNEPTFDKLVREAAILMNTPIALISLIDTDRQWFKARIGLSAEETPRSISFCTHAIRQDGVMIVEDAIEDHRFASNPLVTSGPCIRFYAGAPLKTSEGQRIGTLCAIDSKPHAAPGPADQVRLERLAARIMDAFEHRRQSRGAG